MTSYAELLQTCAEFQENFAVLSARLQTSAQELQSEKELTARLREEVQGLNKQETKLVEQARALKKELESAYGYKERYFAANVTLEQMKGRLENARRSVADTLLEHDQEVDQLKTQIKDLLVRVDVASEGARRRELQKQLVEMEERCAVQNAQLIEEKERFGQQLLAAHNALREQQSRNLELEQRYRVMESEVAEMRSAVRRSADLQNEAALLQERHASDAARALLEVERLRKEGDDLRQRLAEAGLEHAAALEAMRHTTAEETHTLASRLASATAALHEAVAARQAERERLHRLQRSTAEQVRAARAEAEAEVDLLRQTIAALKEEGRRAEDRLGRAEAEAEECHRAVAQEEARGAALAAAQQDLQRQLDASVQQEAWTAAEKRHLAEQLQVSTRRVEELTAALRTGEAAAFELEKLRLHLQFQEEEKHQSRRYCQEVETRVREVEAAAAKRLRAMKHELKGTRRQMKLEAAKADALRRRLVQSLVEKEAAVYHDRGAAGGDAAEVPVPLTSSSWDVLSLLKTQNEQAEMLHRRLLELSR